MIPHPRSLARIAPLLLFAAAALFANPGNAAETTLRSVAGLRQALLTTGRVIADLQVQGVVCASADHLLALQDEGGETELLELDCLPANLTPGSFLSLEGTNVSVTRGAFAIQLGTAPVAELDGVHQALERSGQAYLHQGLQPLRVEWFNASGSTALALDWEGPGLARQRLPKEALWRASDQSGLNYAAYQGEGWLTLPDFSTLTPSKQGVASDFDLSLRTQAESSGLVFSGFLKAPADGVYTFHLGSDDGGRVFIASSPLTCRTGAGVHPIVKGAGWDEITGQLNFIAHRIGGEVELELFGANGDETSTVSLPGADSFDFSPLLHQQIRVQGVRSGPGLIALSPDFIAPQPAPSQQQEILTHAASIRRLTPEEADRPYRVDLRGVITMINFRTLVLQDASGGVFVHYVSSSSADEPRIGQEWRIEGITGSGDFSPVVHADRASFLGQAVLPKPVRPTWEQLVTGSLDAEQVEIEAVVVAASETEFRLGTRDGSITLASEPFYPLPEPKFTSEQLRALPGSVVKIRGVYASSWDMAIHRVHPAVLRLGSATLTIEEPAPADPFSAPLVQASGLLLFTPPAGALKPVRVRGVVTSSRTGEILACDGEQGFRIAARETPPLQPGDEIEAVGFPHLGGPSPVLLEALVRKTGTSSLPAAETVDADRLPDAKLDASRVQLEAVLLSDTSHQDARALELRCGANRFFAYLPPGGTEPLQRDSVLSLTGTYVSASPERALANPDLFELRLNSAADIVVLQRGPWWTSRHTVVVVTILSGSLALAVGWVSALRRTVTGRTRQLALEIQEREEVERHRLMEQERSRVAQDLHDELGSGLTEAGMLAALLKNPAISQEAKDDYLKQLSGVCFSLVTGLDEIVWAVNPRYDSVADLAGYFSLFAQRFLALADIRCRLHIDDAIPELPLDPSRRHGAFLALKEALNNIVRHSGAQEVHLSIAVADEELRITITDDGHGFDPAALPPGSEGVRGMQERIALLGGVCLLESRPGKGATVRFHISLERTYP